MLSVSAISPSSAGGLSLDKGEHEKEGLKEQLIRPFAHTIIIGNKWVDLHVLSCE